MFTLDRYLLRQFVQIFVICFLSLMGLYMVIDAFGHLDQFSAGAATQGGLFQTIAKYYAYHSLAFFDRTSGILAMISAMFTVTWLQRHQELTAIMAAGISKWRIVRPLLIAATAVSFAGMANRELLIPHVRDEVGRDVKHLSGAASRDLEPRFDRRTDILIGGERIIPAERVIVHPAFVLPAELSQFGKQLTAEVAQAFSATNEHGDGFILSQKISPPELCRQPTIKLNDRAVIITPVDAPWLKEDQLFVESEVPFAMLASGASWRNYASIGELIGQLNRPATDLGPEVRVAVHSRLVQPLADGTLLMLGVPLMLSRRSRNVFLSIGICVGVATAFTLASLACQSLGGLSLLRPSLAAWLPLMLFAPVAAALSHNLRT